MMTPIEGLLEVVKEYSSDNARLQTELDLTRKALLCYHEAIKSFGTMMLVIPRDGSLQTLELCHEELGKLYEQTKAALDEVEALNIKNFP